MSRTLIHADSVFDGTCLLPFDAVLIEDRTIAAVGPFDALASADVEIVEARGETLLPGLIDAHVHVFSKEHLLQALIFGVTTVLDMFMDVRLAKEIREQLAADAPGAENLADLRSSGTAVTAPGGHGTEYGLPIPTIRGPDEADEFVEARIREGSDYIKIIYDDVHSRGGDMPTLSKDTMRAVVAAAHRAGRIAVVHVFELRQAIDAIEAEADGLAHLFTDEDPDWDFGRLAAEHSTFIIPTLTMMESACGLPGGATLADHPAIGPWLDPEAAARLARPLPLPPAAVRNYDAARMAVRMLRDAGATILAGSDAPNPGTAHGVSLHRELELLVDAGLSETEALLAATSLPATVFGLHDRGRIVPGLQADLLLVRGDPLQDITATRNVVAVWRQGHRVERRRFRQQPAERGVSDRPAETREGAISNFESGTLDTRVGSLSRASDAVTGGRSTVDAVVFEDAGTHAVRVSGEVVPVFAYPWAGLSFTAGSSLEDPKDLSRWLGIRFLAKGQGADHCVILVSPSLGVTAVRRPFQIELDWREVRIAFTDFEGTDGHDVAAIIFAATKPGPFEFCLAEIELWV